MKTLQVQVLKLFSFAYFVVCLPVFFAGCSTTHSTQSALLGKWQFASANLTIIYEFLPDRTYVYRQTSPNMSSRGRYEVESSNLLILTNENGNAKARQFVLKGTSLLWISNDGSVEEFRRVED
jgi:hypothetical protein